MGEEKEKSSLLDKGKNFLKEKGCEKYMVEIGGEVVAKGKNEKQKIWEALENLSAGGSTAGGEGLKLAYEIAGAGCVPGYAVFALVAGSDRAAG